MIDNEACCFCERKKNEHDDPEPTDPNQWKINIHTTNELITEADVWPPLLTDNSRRVSFRCLTEI